MSVVRVPRAFKPTHQTAGLPGYPAVDLFAAAGTPIVMDEDGTVTRLSGHDPALPPPQGQGGPWGLSCYFRGDQSGNVYYLTHLARVVRPGFYRAGETIGEVGNYPGNTPGGDHVHVGLHKGDSPEAHYASKLFGIRCLLPAVPHPDPAPRPGRLPGPVPKPAWFWAAVKRFLADRKKP